MEDIKKITENCIQWASDNFGSSFLFRPYQLDCIVSAINNVINSGSQITVRECPTGSGKSITALVTCGVLWKYYHKRSYILCSDLGLIDQYKRDIIKYNLGFGVIKGQQSYICNDNNLCVKTGTCKLAGVSFFKLMRNDETRQEYPCAESCQYILERQLAMQAPVTLVTYSFFLIQMNIVNAKVIDQAFPERDFVICDECHKLPEIVQSHFSPVLEMKDKEKIDFVCSSGKCNNLDKRYQSMMHEIYDSVTSEQALSVIARLSELFLQVSSDAYEILKDTDYKHLSREDCKMIRLASWAEEQSSALSEYNNMIEDVGQEYLVKNCNTADKITLNCICEAEMIWKYFHKFAEHCLLMSATIGSGEAYGKSVGADFLDDPKKDYDFQSVPSTFSFNNCPIYYMRKYKLSYKQKTEVLPHILDYVNMICNYYKGFHGIIQTGSYEIMVRLKENTPKEISDRIITYSNSIEKREALQKFFDTPESILAGPSIVEGISLDDDKCRFLIIMKTPFPSLADKLVTARLNVTPWWYSYTTANNVIQGIGRGIRHTDDWCHTYILDGTFDNVINSGFIPVPILKRIQVMNE